MAVGSVTRLQISWSLFPKFFSHLSLPALAELVREVGLDTTNLVVRDGFQVTPEYMAEELPLFLRVMRREGLEIRFATTDYSAETLLAKPEILTQLAEAGIRDFRMGHFPDRGGDVREALRQARARAGAPGPALRARRNPRGHPTAQQHA